MYKYTAIVLALIVVVISVLIIFIMKEDDENTSEISFTTAATIEYRFRDASVPPEFHRSYTIIADNNEVRIEVDSYGDILAEETIELSPSEFEGLIERLNEIEIREKEDDTDKLEGCTGGTGESISIIEEGEIILDGSVSYCGGDSAGNLSGDVKGFGNELSDLFGDLEGL